MNAQRQIWLGGLLDRNQREANQHELLVRMAELDTQIALDATAMGLAAKLVFPEMLAAQPLYSPSSAEPGPTNK